METTEFEKRLKIYKLIHLAMVTATIMYILVIYLIHKNAPLEPIITDENTLNMLVFSSFAYTVFLFIIVPIIKNIMLKSKNMYKSKIKSESKIPIYESNYLTRFFILWTIIETGAIFGLLLYLIGALLTYSSVIIGLNAFLMFLISPNKNELEKLAQNEPQEI